MKRTLYFFAFIYLQLLFFPSMQSWGKPDYRSGWRYLEVTLSIPRENYYLNERIPITMRICNKGDDPSLLHIFSILHTSFRLVAQKPDGLMEELKVPWFLQGIRWTEEERKIYYGRENRDAKYIMLESGECFSRRILLDEVYRMQPGQRYSLKGYFFPDFLYYNSQYILSKNSIRIRLENPSSVAVKRSARAQQQNPGIDGIGADEVVFLYLKGFIEGKKRLVLKYLDLPQFIQAFDAYARDFNGQSSARQQEALERFEEYLIRSRHDYLMDFRIVRTEMDAPDAPRAFVHAYIKRYGGAVPILFQYIYTLEKQRDLALPWKIVDLKVIRRQDMDFFQRN